MNSVPIGTDFDLGTDFGTYVPSGRSSGRTSHETPTFLGKRTPSRDGLDGTDIPKSTSVPPSFAGGRSSGRTWREGTTRPGLAPFEAHTRNENESER
jgi:hypothetical protein